MKKLYLIICCYLMIANTLFAETGNIRTDALLDSARQYFYSDEIKAYYFISELKQNAIILKNKTALSYAYHLLAVMDQNHGDNEAALKNYETALQYADQSGNKSVRLRILIALSTYYLNLSEVDKSITICHQGIKEASAIGNTELTSQFYNNLALSFRSIKEYKQALFYSDKSIELKKGSSDELSLANAYLNKGLLLTETGNYTEGFHYYNQAEEIYFRHNIYTGLTQVNINFAWDYIDMKQYLKSRQHLSKALTYAEKSNDKNRITGAWNAMGYYYSHLGYSDSTVFALKKGLELSLEAENKANTLIAYEELSKHYKNTGEIKLAFEYITRAYHLKDTIFDQSKIQLAQSLNARYESIQKEEQIKLLNTQQENNELIIQKQRWALFSILLLITIVFTFAFLFFKSYQKRQQVRKINELKIHKEAERIRIARDMHDEIGAGLTRIVMRSEQVKLHLKSVHEIKNETVESLEKMATESRELSHSIGEIIWALNPKNDTLDTLCAYIRNYTYDYLDNAGIQCKINFPETIPAHPISPELRRNIFLIIKESLHNTVKHSGARSAEVTLDLSSTDFSLKITDDGKGISSETLPGKGNGLENMKRRTEEMGGEFIIKSNRNEGTTISVREIPIRKNTTKV